MRDHWPGSFLLSVLALLLISAAASGQPTSEPFKGQSIAIEIGYGPGGGYDTYARALARHYGRFIPGNPTVVPKNMPGGGSLRAANYIYNLAPKDGTELGAWAASTVMEPLMGNDQAKFDATKFGWVGSMNQDISLCGLWSHPGGPQSFADMLNVETVFGSAGQASISYQHPLILKNVLGAKVKVITGYAGTRDVNLAMQRGEVHGACGLVAVRAGEATPRLAKTTDHVFYGRAGFLGYVAGNEQERSAVPHVDLPPEIIEMPTLIDLVGRRRVGRVTDAQTSFFLNVGAIGAQFEGVAAAVYQKAREQGLGREIPSEWFLQDVRD